MSGYKFRRQYGIGRYVVDFYCPKAKCVIEIDGDSHYTDEAREYDSKREDYIRALNIKIIRFTNLEVRNNLTQVLQVIDDTLLTPPPSAPPLK